MIAISISNSDPSRLLSQAARYGGLAQVLEIRIDALSRPPSLQYLRELVDVSAAPVIFTCRKADEGGMFSGSEAERLDLISMALQADPAFMDIELQTEQDRRQDLIAQAENRGIRPIVSWHDFSGTPDTPELISILDRSADTGAEIIKMVTMARESHDFCRVVPLFSRARKRHGIKLIAFCMGEAGRYSRVSAPFMGSMLTFAATDEGSSTAPGQIPFMDLQAMLQKLGYGVTVSKKS